MKAPYSIQIDFDGKKFIALSVIEWKVNTGRSDSLFATESLKPIKGVRPKIDLTGSIANANEPTLIHKVTPIYPDLAKRARISGEVILRITIIRAVVPVVDLKKVDCIQRGSRKFHQGRIRQQEAARFEHAGDIGHSQALFEKVVVDQYVCGHNQIEFLRFRKIQSLENDIHFTRGNTQDDLRPDAHGAHSQAADAGRKSARFRWRSDLAAELLPVGDGPGFPGGIEIARQLHDIGSAAFCPPSRRREMADHVRADIQCRHIERARLREASPHKRINQSKRLKGLLRIEVVASLLIGEIKAGSDDGRAFHGLQQAAGLYGLERLLDGIVGKERCINRQPARAIERLARGEHSAGIPGPPSLLDCFLVALLLLEHSE